MKKTIAIGTIGSGAHGIRGWAGGSLVALQ